MSFRTSLVFLYLMPFIIYTCSSIQRSYVPLFAVKELGATLVEAGLIASASGLAGAIASTPMGILNDRFGRKRFVILGAIMLGIISLVIASASTPSQVIVAFAFTGLSASMTDPSLAATIADVVKRGRLGRAYGLFETVVQFSFSLGPTLGGLIIMLLGFRSAFYAVGVFIFLGAGLATLIPQSSPQRFERERISLLARSGLKNAHLRLGWVLAVVTGFMMGGFNTYLPLYLHDVGYDIVMIGLLLTSQSVSSTLSRLPIGMLFDKLNAEELMAFVGVLAASACIAVFSFIHNPLSLTLILLLLGPSGGMINVVTSVIVAEHAPPASRGLLMGLNITFRFIGFSLGPVAIASVMSMSGGLRAYSNAFIMLAVTATVLTAAAIAMTKGRDTPQ